MNNGSRYAALILLLPLALAASAFGAQDTSAVQSDYDAGIENRRR